MEGQRVRHRTRSRRGCSLRVESRRSTSPGKEDALAGEQGKGEANEAHDTPGKVRDVDAGEAVHGTGVS